MWRQVVAQIPRRAQPAIGARLAQFGDRLDQLVDLLLLPHDDFVELVNLVFGVAGFDFQLGQAVVGVLCGFDSRLPCMEAYYNSQPAPLFILWVYTQSTEPLLAYHLSTSGSTMASILVRFIFIVGVRQPLSIDQGSLAITSIFICS